MSKSLRHLQEQDHQPEVRRGSHSRPHRGRKTLLPATQPETASQWCIVARRTPQYQLDDPPWGEHLKTCVVDLRYYPYNQLPTRLPNGK